MSDHLGPVVHGGLQEAELRALGLDPASIVDLSANLHPAGPHPAVLAAARGARLDRYPPADAAPLRDAIAAASNLDPAMVLPTPGATAALHLIARVVLQDGGAAAAFGPTFGEYAAASRAAGSRLTVLHAPPPDFAPPLNANDARAAWLTFVCQPNNPTGVYLDRAALVDLARASRLLVVDAAYNDFVTEPWDPDDLVREGLPVLVVHSMTKLHSIPGLRLGYVVGRPDVIARLAAHLPSWSIDAASLAAGLVAAGQREARMALLAPVHARRERLREAARAAGMEVAPGQANFLMLRTGDAPRARRALLSHGFLVRDCTSFGLPEWIRVAIPAPEHEAALRDALTEVAGAMAVPE